MADAQREANDLQTMTQAQLETYAAELRDLYYEERRLRGDLEREKQELEQRVRELTALNKMVQQNLASGFETGQTVDDLARRVRAVAEAVEQTHLDLSARVGELSAVMDSLVQRMGANAGSDA